jgi:ribosomal protein S18 acetylase RimI-like enzyme
VEFHIRDSVAADHDAIVALGLRAWAPVFASVEAILGSELNTLLHGEDWREYQAQAIRDTLADPANDGWVAEAGGRVAGFAVATVADADRRIGEIGMLAVDPAAQGRGAGRALTDHATEWLRAAGMRVVFIATGGDPGHAPARAVYEGAGYRLLPAAQYLKAL